MLLLWFRLNWGTDSFLGSILEAVRGQPTVACAPNPACLSLYSEGLGARCVLYILKGWRNKNTGQRQIRSAKPKIVSLWRFRENSCWPLIFNITRDQNAQWVVDTAQVLDSLNELLFWKLILVSQSVKRHYCLQKGGFRSREIGRFSSGSNQWERNIRWTVHCGWIFLLSPCWWTFWWRHLGDPPHGDGAPCWKSLMGNKTLLTYTKMIHFLVSLLWTECWPEFYNLCCLLSDLGKKDVFCNKKESEMNIMFSHTQNSVPLLLSKKAYYRSTGLSLNMEFSSTQHSISLLMSFLIREEENLVTLLMFNLYQNCRPGYGAISK